jgi:hypothetical protein
MQSFTIILALTVFALSACGGGSSSAPLISSSSAPPASSSSSSPDSPVSSSSASPVSSSSSSAPSVVRAGIFDVNYAGFTGVYTFLDNGEFYGLHFNSATLLGYPHGILSNSNSTSQLEPIAWANFVDDALHEGAMEANGSFGRTLDPETLAVSINFSAGAFTAQSATKKPYSLSDTHSIYNDPLSLTRIAGSYKGFVRTAGISRPITSVTDLIIAGDGTFTTTVVNCTFTGSLAQHGSTGVFDVHVTTSGGSCQLASSLKGILVPLKVENNALSLSLQLNDANNSQAAVFIVNSTPTINPVVNTALIGVGTTGYAGVQGMFDVRYFPSFFGNYTILETGEYYGIDMVNDSAIGLAHGALTSNGSAVATYQASHYNSNQSPVAALVLGTVDGTYTAPALTLHIFASEGTRNFGATGSASDSKKYSTTDATVLYDNPIPMASIAGTYTGFLLKLGTGVASVAPSTLRDMTIAADGSYSVTVSGCVLTGTMTPHGSKAAFDSITTVTGSACSIHGIYKGIVAPQRMSAGLPTLAFQLYGPTDPTQTAPQNALLLYVTKQ